MKHEIHLYGGIKPEGTLTNRLWRDATETRLAIVGLLLGVGLGVGFGAPLNAGLRAAAAVGSVALLVLVLRSRRARHWLMTLAERTLGR